MTAAAVIAALCLPADARVEQRVPKKLLVENGAPTAADKRQINDGIEELQWLAALKPGTIGVPAYRDDTREYLEIAVLTLALRPKAGSARIVELIHRAIPYPALLVATQADTLSLSLARKRHSQNEAGCVVLDEAPIICPLDASPMTSGWLPGLALTAQPRAHLLALYQGWIACVEALQTARITGRPAEPATPAAQETRRQALADHGRLQREIADLRARAKKERQISRRVSANLAIKRLEAELAAVVARLGTGIAL